MKVMHRPPLLLYLSLTSLLLTPGCVQPRWTKLTNTTAASTIPQSNGTTRPGKVTYQHTASREGTSQDTAVEIRSYNAISGSHAERHLLSTRFPQARATKLPDVLSGREAYHCYKIQPQTGQPFVFWIHATSYHDVF